MKRWYVVVLVGGVCFIVVGGIFFFLERKYIVLGFNVYYLVCVVLIVIGVYILICILLIIEVY